MATRGFALRIRAARSLFAAPPAAACLLGLLAPGCASREAAPAPPLVLPEHYARSIAAVGVPGARRAFQVGPGSRASTGELTVAWSVEGDSTRVSPVFFEADAVPVAHWWMAGASESLHFEAAAAPRPELGDTSALLSVRVTAFALGGSRPIALVTRVLDGPASPGFVPWDAVGVVHEPREWRQPWLLWNGRHVVRLPPQAAWTGERAGARAGTAMDFRHVLRPEPGRPTTLVFEIPAYGVSPSTARRFESLDHERIAGDARRLWRRWLARAASLHTPDTLVNAAFRAGLVTLLVCQERSHGEWVPIGNPFQYRDVWLRDAARAVRALCVAGLAGVARSDAVTLLRFQLPSGALMSQRGQLDGTGQALWAMAQAASIPPSRAWARRFMPAATRASEWIVRERGLGRRHGAPWPGLLPYADPRDNELVRAQLVGNDAWSCAGLSALAALARLAGDPSRAAGAEAEAARYRADVAAALARTGSSDIPASWQGHGRDWGNLTLGYPTFVLGAADPRLQGLARRVWSGSHARLLCWGDPDSVHGYIGGDVAQWAARGAPALAREYLDSLLAASTSTLGQAELSSRKSRDFGDNLPPHATAAAQVVDLVRNLIVDDARDTLEIATGADASWWRGTRLSRAPTRWGVIDVSLDEPSPGVVRVRMTPVAVPARVWMPDRWILLTSLAANARVVTGRYAVLAPHAREASFRVAPRAGEP